MIQSLPGGEYWRQQVHRFDTVFRNIKVFQPVSVDFPNVNSNATVSGDISTVSSFPLGTALITWGFLDDASTIQDLQIQILFIDTDTLRFTLHNPTGGAIDPGAFDMFFVTGELNLDIDDTPI
jgi:hypothetical protein